jgi:hypothetical protein
MGLLSDDKLLTEIAKYLDNTDFTNQEIGHRLALTFIPPHLEPLVEDLRYSFHFKHKLLDKVFDNATYGGMIVELVMALNAEISKNINMVHREIYEEVGLIEDGRCTKELISTVIAMGIAVQASFKKGNTTTNVKKTDNLQNVFPEFNEQAVQYFLDQVDNYQPTI